MGHFSDLAASSNVRFAPEAAVHNGDAATNGAGAKHADFHCALPLRTTWNAIRRTDLDGAADPDNV